MACEECAVVQSEIAEDYLDKKAEVARLTTANADLQQRMDAAEEALRVAQGEVAELKKPMGIDWLVQQQQAVNDGLNKRLTAANSRVERLRESLEPFGRIGADSVRSFDGESPVEILWPAKGKVRGMSVLHIADFIRVRETLARDSMEGV